MSEVLLAVDLGFGSLRVGAVTPAGDILAQTALPLADIETAPGWSEIDPEIWWRALSEGVAQVLGELGGKAEIIGLCIAGLTRSQIFLDRDGNVLRHALLFRDRRAAAEAAEVAAYFRNDNPADEISSFHPLARLAWLHHHEPDLYNRLHAMVEPKDYLNFRLTGTIGADSVTYSRFDALEPLRVLPPWLDRCVNALALERTAPWACLGAVTNIEAPFDRIRGVPVFTGAMDAWATAVGSGCVRPGQGYDIAGSSENAGLMTSTRVTAPGLVSLSWTEGAFQIGGPTQVGADSARWAHETFRSGGDLAGAVERAGSRPPSPELPLFLPYLAGERAPLWRSDVRGAFHGISYAHEPDDFLWSVLEGAAHAVQDILLKATAESGEALSEIRTSGGGAKSNAWCQLKADVVGVPLLRDRQAESGLIGCAMAAAVGLGIYPTLAVAAETMCHADRIFEPRPDFAAFHQERAARYQLAKRMALEMASSDKASS